MSGYTPIFRSVFDGTLHGRWPQTGVWLALLAMVDRNGHIDRSPQAIASDIGISVDELMVCIDEFCSPDPMSRTRDNDGRRLALIDDARPWGWRVLNHGKYREKARKAAYDADRTTSGADAARKAAARAGSPAKPLPSPTRPDASRALPLSYTDTDTDTDTDTKAKEAPADAVASSIGTPGGVNAEAWTRWEDYLRLIGKRMNALTRPAAMRHLVAFGDADTQSAVVEQAIASGWKTLHPLRQQQTAGATVKPCVRKTADELEAECRARGEDPYALIR